MRPPPNPGRRRGVAAVEFALIMPYLVAILLGLWQASCLLEAQQALIRSAREGARWASTGNYSADAVQQVVIQSLASSGVPTANVSVAITDLDAPAGTDPTAALKGDRLLIRVTIPFRDVSWAVPTYLTPAPGTLSTQMTWYSVKEPN